jgi:hypothetical protein
MADQLQARLAELEAERGRLRDAITRFGEALAATHDMRQLLRVIVEAAVEATGARGARLLAEDGTIVETGDPDADGELLEFPLKAARTAFGTLTIVGDRFDEEQRMSANSLASSGRRSSTGSPALRTAASARSRSPRRSPRPTGSGRRSPSSSPTSTTSRR